MPTKAKVLFLAASPEGQPHLKVKKELRRVREAIRGSTFEDRITLVPYTTATLPDLLKELVRLKPEIVHFSGHGEEAGELIFANDEGRSAPASPAALRRLFDAVGESVKLVVLNACFSETQAEAITKTVDFAVGMTREIHDDPAITFAEYFYTAIAWGDSVGRAFAAGRASLDLTGTREEDTPQLLWGAYANPDREFLWDPDEPDRLVRRRIELSPPPELAPVHGYRYGLHKVREGRDEDGLDLIKGTDALCRFVERGVTLRATVEYHERWGLQFKCYVDCPDGTSAFLARRPEEWRVDPQPDPAHPDRVWFLLGDPQYVTYTTRTGFENNYIAYSPPQPPPSEAATKTPRTRSDNRPARRRPAGRSPAEPVARTPTAARQGTGSALTSNLDEFISLLKPGDILLMDSVHPLSGLIQFAENRPVSHAALYVGPRSGRGRRAEQFIQTTRHTATKPAARQESLRDRLKEKPGPYDRTVTALRHREVIEGRAGTDAVLSQADEYLEAKTTYAYLSLVTLMPLSLFRSYEQYLREGRLVTRQFNRLFGGVTRMFTWILNATGGDPHERPQPGKRTLTCSEFVFRCYEDSGSGLHIDVDQPLNRWATRSRAAGPRRSGAGKPGTVGGVELIEFDESLTTVLSPPAVRSTRTADPEAVARQELARRMAEVAGELVGHNLALSKYGAEAKVSRSARSEVVVPDMVTPRDLWSSPSLEVCAVLHRPPTPDDSDLDLPH